MESRGWGRPPRFLRRALVRLAGQMDGLRRCQARARDRLLLGIRTVTLGHDAGFLDGGGARSFLDRDRTLPTPVSPASPE